MSGGERAKDRPRKVRDPPGPTGTSAHADPIRAYVIAHFWQLAADGLAVWSPMRGGDVEFRLSTGEAFVLGYTSITRIA
jgi:hypothetical protein